MNDPSGGTVHVVGSLNLDQTLTVRSFPAEGETIKALRAARSPGGKGANQAAAAAAAGAPARMVGAVGVDEAGARVVEDLALHGVDVSSVQRLDGTPSGGALVLLREDGENMIVLLEGANALLDPVQVARGLDAVTPRDIVLVQNEISPIVTARAATAGHDKRARVVWNCAPSPAQPAEIVSVADLIVANEVELRALAQLLGVAAEAVAEQAQRVAERLEVDLVCTLGAAGALGVRSGVVFRVAVPAVAALDSTGAGDAFVGYLAAGLLAGYDLERAMGRASIAGAISVTRAGAMASVPSKNEVDTLSAAML